MIDRLIYFFVDGSPEAYWYEVLNIDIDEIHCCNNMAARDSNQKSFPTAAMLSIHIHCVLIFNHVYVPHFKYPH